MKIVDRGAELLDKVEPGWDERIDLDALDLGKGCNCVLGQLYRVEHPRMRYKWDAFERKLAELPGVDWNNAGRFGFIAVGPTRYHNLTAAWRRLIERRRKS